MNSQQSFIDDFNYAIENINPLSIFKKKFPNHSDFSIFLEKIFIPKKNIYMKCLPKTQSGKTDLKSLELFIKDS